MNPSIVLALWILGLAVALHLVTTPEKSPEPRYQATLRAVCKLIIQTGIVIWAIIVFGIAELKAQTASTTATCWDSTRKAYWPKPKIGDSLVVVVRTLKPTLTGCARPQVRVPAPVIPPPVITPPPVVTPTPPPGASNEPTGMTKLAERDFSVLDDRANGWYFGQDYANGAVVVSVPNAPRSPNTTTAGNVVQQNFTSLLNGGSSPAYLGRGVPASQTLYVSLWMLVSPNWVGHPSNVNKVIHFYTARNPTNGNTSNRAIFTLRGSGANPLVPSFGLQALGAPYRWTEPNGAPHFETEANLEPNLSPCRTMRGQWHRYEMVLVGNTPGVSDGTVEWWMDGVKCARYTGIAYVAAGFGNKWEEFNWSPTYGGGAVTITQSFFSQVDHVYVSGK